jgi:hypothetical protein
VKKKNEQKTKIEEIHTYGYQKKNTMGKKQDELYGVDRNQK